MKSEDRDASGVNLSAEEQHRLTVEALTDVESGNVVDHAVVRAWAESLGHDPQRSRR